MIWSQSILFSFNFTSFFLGTSKNVQVFPDKSLSRKESISIQQNTFEEQVFLWSGSSLYYLEQSISLQSKHRARCSVPVITFFLGRLWHRAKKSPWTRAQLHLMMVPVWRWEQMRSLSTLPTDLKFRAIFTNSCFNFQERVWDHYAQWWQIYLWNCFVQNPFIIIRVPLVGSTSVFASQQDPE